MPIRPRSPSCLTIAYGNAFVRSSSSASGATSPSAKSRTVLRISSWSSERSKSMPYLYRTLVTNASFFPTPPREVRPPPAGGGRDRRRAVRAPRLPGDEHGRAQRGDRPAQRRPVSLHRLQAETAVRDLRTADGPAARAGGRDRTQRRRRRDQAAHARQNLARP